MIVKTYRTESLHCALCETDEVNVGYSNSTKSSQCMHAIVSIRGCCVGPCVYYQR